jgi:putative sigma-54 modulation protein
MNINIKTTNLTITDAIQTYVDKRLDKISKLLAYDESVQCNIELARTTAHHNKGDIFRAEIHIIGKGKDIYSSSEKSDLYTAIDDARQEVLRNIKANREKKISFVRRGGARVKAMMKGLWPWRNK